ncbi:MAG TPA: response regulator transcription factor [Rhodocyclaceae bacterium]|nr:response regulator transcription factor [Rhodocyclaceae bacterium]
MTDVVHIFVSHHGDLLPRWQAAFPDASGVLSSYEKTLSATHLWLRLRAEQEVPPQVNNAHRLGPDSAVLVLSDAPNDDEGLSAFAEGARAYCNTHSNPEMLKQVADVVAQGGLWIGESLMQRLLTTTSKMARAANAPRQDWAAVLTPRELEVARAVANGSSNKEIARELDITERTVKAHVGAILEKLQVRDRLQISLKINGLSRS